LGIHDHHKIKQHLNICRTCRQHCTTLEHTTGLLASAAAELAIDPEAPSLWPILERRIEAQTHRTSPRWLRMVQNVGDRCARAWMIVNGERPLHRAWLRDSLLETLAHQPWQFGATLGLRLLLGVSSAAFLFVVLYAIPVLRRQEATALSVINVNATPLPVPVFPEANLPDELAERSDSDSNLPADQIVQAEPPRTSDVPSPSAGNTAPPKPRLGYDLEHGIPMAPDVRDSKPVY
jgi:hypothetical protein